MANYLCIYFLKQGNSLKDQKNAAMAGLKMSCQVCKSMMPDPKTYKQVECTTDNCHPRPNLPYNGHFSLVTG